MSNQDKLHRARALLSLVASASHDEQCDSAAISEAVNAVEELLGEIADAI